MPMEKIAELNERFDIVVSSLAFHYVEDFEGVVSDIYNMLDTEGIFIFSQENPLCTCHSGHQTSSPTNSKGYSLDRKHEKVV